MIYDPIVDEWGKPPIPLDLQACGFKDSRPGASRLLWSGMLAMLEQQVDYRVASAALFNAPHSPNIKKAEHNVGMFWQFASGAWAIGTSATYLADHLLNNKPLLIQKEGPWDRSMARTCYAAVIDAKRFVPRDIEDPPGPKRLTLRQFGELLDRNAATVLRWKKHSPTLPRVVALAPAFDGEVVAVIRALEKARSIILGIEPKGVL